MKKAQKALKEYEIKIKSNALCGNAKLIAKAAIENKTADNLLVRLNPEKNGMGKYEAFASETRKSDSALFQDATCRLGQLELENDTMTDGTEIDSILSAKYEIQLETVNESNEFTGKLSLLSPVSSIEPTEEKAEKEPEPEIEAPDLQKIIEEKIASGIVTRDDLNDRIRCMKENLFDDDLICKIVSSYKSYTIKQPQRPSTEWKDPWLSSWKAKRKNTYLQKACRNAVARNALILEGPKSVGKNVFTETVAWIMGMPLFLITFAPNMSPSAIYGEKSTDNSAAAKLRSFNMEDVNQGKILLNLKTRMIISARNNGADSAKAETMVMSAFSETDRKNMRLAGEYDKASHEAASVSIVIDHSELYDWLVDGGIMCFNEMNLAEPAFFASFTNQLTDGTGFIDIPGRGEVRINPYCVLFGTQNADYAGCQQQNEATVSRFGCIRFKQPDNVKTLLKAATQSKLRKDGYANLKLDDEYYVQAERFYKNVFGAATKGNAEITDSCLNIRGFVRALSVVAEAGGYDSLADELETQVINTCDAEEAAALSQILRQCVTL